ncbi:MAG: hypothetical protein ACOC5T_04650 [Elusimicrobiota bacterium]
MTLGIAVECEDGILLACDSMSVYGRGVPVQRESNKIYTIKKDRLENGEINVVASGTTAFFDKFIRMIRNTDLEAVADEISEGYRLSITDFVNRVAEPLASSLRTEYLDERKLGGGGDELFTLIIGGFENGYPTAYILFDVGLAEPLENFGTIGSGAAYAELFLRNVLPEKREINDVIKLVCYTISLVGIMDPYVGGKINLGVITKEGYRDVSHEAVDVPIEEAKKLLKENMKNLIDSLDEYGE